MPKRNPATDAEIAALRDRALLIVTTFEREEPSPTWAQLRELVERAKRLSDLRSINQDLRGAMQGLSRSSRQELDRALGKRFGPDREQERDRQAVAKIRTRGRIRSEREYRVVQGYADSIGADPGAQDEFLALGALLDEYMAAPKLPNGR